MKFFKFILACLLTFYSYSQKVSVIEKLDTQPCFPGGMKELTVFILDNVKPLKKNASIAGDLLISISIDTSGRVSSVEIIRGLSRTIDEDIINVLKSSPLWSPGEIKGIKVKSILYLSLRYRHYED